MRMAHAGGIGTYVRQLVPRVLERLPSLNLCLLHEQTPDLARSVRKPRGS